tara:strand:+ start:4619 stop:4822 length:204 start_codon:yes stop_codon:yes gene_type:complete
MEKIYKAQYEFYVGKKFYYKTDKDLIYTFGAIEDGQAQVSDASLDSVPYEIEEVLGLIRDNIWIVLD